MNIINKKADKKIKRKAKVENEPDELNEIEEFKKTESDKKLKKNLMTRKGSKILILIIGLAVILLLFKNIYQKSSSDLLKLESVRGTNVDSTRIIDDGVEYIIENQVLLQNGKPLIRVGDYDKNMISKIDNYIFLQDFEGLVKYDIENDVVHKLYYDTMSYSAAGINYIYYITDNALYRISDTGSYEVVDEGVSEKIAFLHGDHLYYLVGNIVRSINLINDDVNDVDVLEKAVDTFSEENSYASEGCFNIVYSDGDIKQIDYLTKETD